MISRSKIAPLMSKIGSYATVSLAAPGFLSSSNEETVSPCLLIDDLTDCIVSAYLDSVLASLLSSTDSLPIDPKAAISASKLKEPIGNERFA